MLPLGHVIQRRCSVPSIHIKSMPPPDTSTIMVFGSLIPDVIKCSAERLECHEARSQTV